MVQIEKINDKLMVEWIEDQPVIRPVKNHLVRSGIVAELVDILIANNSEAVGRKETLSGLFDRILVEGQYICVVQRLPPDPTPNMPTFSVTMRRYKPGSVNTLDAIGKLYVAPFPEWITDAYSHLSSLEPAKQ